MKTLIAVVAVMMQIVVLAGASVAAPFTRIVSPAPGQCVPGPDVLIQFEAGGMTLGPSAWNLHFKLDEEPFQVQYDGNHAHTFKNVRPGTHTVRVYAANAMHEAIPGTQSIVTFSVGYWDGANAPVTGHPLLTYNLPQGEYLGIDAADITVDFLVENAQLTPGSYQVAYYVDGRRFLVQDQCGPRHIKNLAPGLHRVKIELQDQHGDVISGPFNSTERIIAVSPDKVTKSETEKDDGYTGLPRLDSIKGSMTMGQHWVATQQVKQLTEEEKEQQANLTVETDKGTVALRDGQPIEYPATASTSEESDHTPKSFSSEAESENRFQVRQGGEPEAESDLETAVPKSGVRSGSIIIDSDEPEVGQKEEIKMPEADQPEPVIASETTTRTSRIRADGSISPVLTTSTLNRSTSTLRLQDRPGLRTATPVSTATLHVDSFNSTTTRVEKNTTGTRGFDRESSASRPSERQSSTSLPERREGRGRPDNPRREERAERGTRPQRGERSNRESRPRGADRDTTVPFAAKLD